MLTLWGYALIRQYFPEQMSQQTIITVSKLFGLGLIVIVYFVLVATMNSHKKWSGLLSKPWRLIGPYTVVLLTIAISSWIMYLIINSVTYANWIPIAFIIFTIILSYLRIFLIENANHT